MPEEKEHPMFLKLGKMLMDKVGQDKVFLFMKTDPHDQEGGNLIETAKMLDIRPDQLTFMPQMYSSEQIATFYNISDITINQSSNEGFGLPILESLMCGTPTVCLKTGGLQDQPVDDEGNVFGVLLEPTVNSLQGSQQIFYIQDCMATDQAWLDAYEKMYKMSWEERKELGLKGSEWVRKAFSMKNMIDKWDKVIVEYTQAYKKDKKLNRIKVSKV